MTTADHVGEQEDLLALARFRAMIEETVLPPPHSVELARSAADEYVQRLGARQRNVAETFHANTKLTPFTMVGLPVDERGLDEARKVIGTTSYRVQDSDLEYGREHLVKVPHATCPAELSRLLLPFAEPGPAAELLYSLDLFAIWDGVVHRQPQQAPYLWRERQWNAHQRQAFTQSLLRVPAEAVRTARAALVLAVAPWRYMMFQGPRGYRHTLVDLGKVLALLAAREDVETTVTLDFYDARIDRLLLLDGVERSAGAVVLVKEATP